MEKKNYTISDIYQGGYSSLSPTYGYGDIFSGYRVSAGSLGMSTDARTANILKDISKNISAGAKAVELTQVSPEVFESIPQQHLKELNRLSKLTGVDVSVHAPVVEASGISREGFSEENREAAERQMSLAVERSHEINPKGNIPVTFHSSAIIPQPIIPKGKEAPDEALIINTDNYSIGRIPLKKIKFPGEEEKINIENELKRRNEEVWDENLRQISYYADFAGRAVSNTAITKVLSDIKKREGKQYREEEKEAIAEYNRGVNFLNSSYLNLKNIFSLAYERAQGEEKKKISEFYKKIETNAEKIRKDPKSYESVKFMKEIIDDGIETMQKISPPQIYKPLDDFARDKTVETFTNVAFNSYKKFKDKSPIISIENPPAGMAFSRGEELKNIVEEAKKKFVKKAVQTGMSEKQAKEQAEKLIGVTWDVGHINMLRKYGYEAKDIIKETEAVKKLVKHVHLSDNFGFEHTELPMGMGNVPIKEIMEKLPKKDVKKIIEALSWWQHFSEQGAIPPLKPTLEATGSPIYSMEMAPYWNQSLGFEQGYYTGQGPILPQMSYEMQGAGFSQLPLEFGGQRPGAQGGRMSGRPME